MEHVIFFLDLAGTAVFAISGALAAGRKRMDIFGVVVLGCVTAIGGGTLRDLVLGATPVFWITDTYYLGIAASAALGTFMLACYTRMPSIMLMYADAVGLAVFMFVGYQKGFEMTQAYSIGIVMGVISGVVGGIIRDVLSGEIPLIFRREIYASAALTGATLLAFLSYLEVPGTITVPAAV
ncbi:MAG: trimeric intracellular cation channel family protein, partial [Chromatiales bacterium]|nr:trimeric intracellular cation channel family protein [Chromatiales bacterium]